MWSTVEFDHEPKEVEKDISSVYVYVRKDITKIETEHGDAWTALETKIPQEDWETYQGVLTNTSDITDIQEALADLATLLTEA